MATLKCLSYMLLLKNGRKKLEMDILQPLYELIGIYVREDDEGISFFIFSSFYTHRLERTCIYLYNCTCAHTYLYLS